MIRRASIIGIVALGLTGLAVRTTPAFDRVVSSAQSFQRNFRDLKSAGNILSPIERIVFSLALSTSERPHAVPVGTAPEGRT